MFLSRFPLKVKVFTLFKKQTNKQQTGATLCLLSVSQVVAIRPNRRINHIPSTAEDEEEEEDHDDVVILEKKIRTSSMSEQALKVCLKEIKR